MHVVACISTRKDRESSFHHCGGSVKFVQAWLSARKHRESSFHHCWGYVKFVQPWLSVPGYIEKALLTTVENL